MNFATHLQIADVLYDGLCKIAALDRESFLYGNVKPDLTAKVFLRPHILTLYLDDILQIIDSLMNEQLSNEDFSENLGEVCHYLSDFFCLYHAREEKFNHFVSHALYESRLHNYHQKRESSFLSKMLDFKVTPVRDLKMPILEYREMYFSMPHTLDLDFFCAYRVCKLVCESIAYYQVKSIPSEQVTQRQASYPKVGGLR